MRPMRFTITEDGLLFVGSETGMVQIEEQRVSEKGRVGTAHLALGDNHNAYPGGQNVCTLHLDGVILDASLEIVDNGQYIVKDGEWAL